MTHFSLPTNRAPLGAGLALAALGSVLSLPPPAIAGDRSDELVIETLTLDGDAARGRRAYQACAGCHGRKAWGDAARLVPALAGQHPGYLVKQMAEFVELERDSKDMHRLFAKPEMSDPQRIADLAAYLRNLAPNPRPETGNSRALPLGGSLYAMACAQCHGDTGEGGDRELVPMLRGQHYSYLLLQMRALATGHRFNTDPDVLDLLDALDTGKMMAVADFITRLTPPAPEE